jgi:hypothetical protein
MIIGSVIELGRTTVKITGIKEWSGMELFMLGNFVSCTVELFDKGIVCIQDKCEDGGSCELYILDTNENKMYIAEDGSETFETYKKIYNDANKE